MIHSLLPRVCKKNARLQKKKQLRNETRNPGILIKKQNCCFNFMKQLLRDTQFFVFVGHIPACLPYR